MTSMIEAVLSAVICRSFNPDRLTLREGEGLGLSIVSPEPPQRTSYGQQQPVPSTEDVLGRLSSSASASEQQHADSGKQAGDDYRSERYGLEAPSDDQE
jgi:hypothetical protein